jgi:hypothetical protein
MPGCVRETERPAEDSEHLNHVQVYHEVNIKHVLFPLLFRRKKKDVEIRAHPKLGRVKRATIVLSLCRLLCPVPPLIFLVDTIGRTHCIQIPKGVFQIIYNIMKVTRAQKACNVSKTASTRVCVVDGKLKRS